MDTQALTVRLPVPMYERLRKAAFERRLPQAELLRNVLSDWLDAPCPDCGVAVGVVHDLNCDVPECPETGVQRLICRDMNRHACPDKIIWRGQGTS